MTKNITPEEKQSPDEKKEPRQIIIETDGNNIKLVKADVAGKIELVAVLQAVINNIDKL